MSEKEQKVLQGETSGSEQSMIQYDAFISYRHAPLDMYIAEKLHHYLETFKLPLLADKKSLKKTKIKRVFRDKEELPVSDNLSDPINQALQNAQYLIVICSPKTPESKWVEKEITTFAKLHGRDRILSVLIEGEPQDSFPYALCHDVNEETGEITEVEPLAADIRADRKEKSAKKLKKEVLRLVAPMLGCGYDDLKQRHKEYRLKKALLIAGIVALFFLAAGSVSTCQALKIHRQSKEISALFTRTQAQRALEQYEEGNCTDAVKTIQNAQSVSTEDAMTAKTKQALSEILHIYDNGDQLLPLWQLDAESDITACDIGENGQYAAAYDSLGNLFAWDITEGSCKYKIPLSIGEVPKNHLQFIKNNVVILVGTEGMCRVDLDNGETSYLNQGECFTDFAFSNNMKYMVVSDSNELQTVELESFRMLYSYRNEDVETAIYGGLAISDNGRYVSYGGYYGTKQQGARLIVRDTREDRELINRQMRYDFPRYATILDDGSGLFISKDTTVTGSFLMVSRECLYFYDKTGESVRVLDDMLATSCKPVVTQGKILIPSETQILVYSANDCKYETTIGFSSTVETIDLSRQSNTVSFYATLSDGSIVQVSGLTDTVYETAQIEGPRGAKGLSFAKSTCGGEKLAIVKQGASRMNIYGRPEGDIETLQMELSGHITSVMYNDKLKKCVGYCVDTGEYFLCDVTQHIEVRDGVPSFDSLIYSMTFNGENIYKAVDLCDGKHFLLVSYTDIHLMKWSDGTEVMSKSFDYVQDVCVDTVNKKLYLTTGTKLIGLTVPKLKETFITESDMPLTTIEAANQGKSIACVNAIEEVVLFDCKNKSFDKAAEMTKLMHVSKDGKSILLADKSKEALRLVDMSGAELLSTPVNAQLVTSLGYSDDGSLIFVKYSTGEFEIRNAKNLTLIKELDEIDSAIGQMTYDKKNKRYCLVSKEWYGEEGYVLDEEFEILAKVSRLFALSEDGTMILSCDNRGDSRLLKSKLASEEELLEKMSTFLESQVKE